MADGDFSFDRYSFDAASATLRLSYSYDGGAAFEEVIRFPAISRDLSAEDSRAVDIACRLIFLLAGVSYYKAFVPPRLLCRAFSLDPETASFVEKVYRNGLGEFSYRNSLDLRDRIRFDGVEGEPPVAANPLLGEALCVPVGGGKDSAVSIECLKESGRPLSLFVLSSPAGVAAPIRSCIEVAGLKAFHVERALSPVLFKLNGQGAYNGHVPITAILSAIAVAACIMQGKNALVMSNEHSASAPNLKYNDLEVNHQYSKSFAFEKDFADYVSGHVAGNFSYFSLLRPLSEAAITRRFAALTAYHPVFRSCNAAFRQEAAQRQRGWCCDCPKCRFVFLALAPFMSRQGLVEIFGQDMLDDSSQMQGFADLCGLGAHKPFECVGEEEESALLLRQVSRLPAWESAVVVRQLAKRLAPVKDFESAYQGLFALKPEHRVPQKYLELLA